MRFQPVRGWTGTRVMRLLAVVCFLVWMTGCSWNDSGRAPLAKDGILDLADWNWDRSGIVPLNGQWKFEWHGSLQEEPPDRATTMDVPGMWNDRSGPDGKKWPDHGYAVYRLTVLHVSHNQLMAIRIPNISTAYELHVDGKPALSRGRVGPDEKNTVPYQMPATLYFTESGPQTELRMIVANYHHRQGGIRSELLMGKAEQIDKLQTRNSALAFIIFGSLIMIGLYHIGLFTLRRQRIANLFFSMLCLFVALRMGMIGEGFILQWFPRLDWDTATRADYLAFVLSGWSGLAYYQRMYPDEIRRLWVTAIGGIAAVLSFFAVLLPTRTFTSWLTVYQAYLLTICVIIIAALILSAYRQREGALLALIGVAGMVLAVINDMLFYNGWRRSVDLVPFGLLFLIFMNSFIIARRASRTYDRAERLSMELRQWNDKLEERIAERTEELRKSNETLEAAKQGLERMELSRRQLVSNISHDLRTPITLLQGYLEALRDGVISGSEQRESTIRLMLGKVEGLNGLIHDLFELSVLEAGRVELSCDCVTLKMWGERLTEQHTQDLQDKGIVFTCDIATEADGSAVVHVDILRMDRVFANLLFNAVRYTPQGGTIRILLRRAENGRMAEIIVEDSGSGIHPDDLPHIFDRFYKKDKSRHSSSGGSGLGLPISREIVELHGGSIGAYNRPEGGSAFRILLPLQK